jgi:membrane-associated HD superfamily phosphohydrolase
LEHSDQETDQTDTTSDAVKNWNDLSSWIGSAVSKEKAVDVYLRDDPERQEAMEQTIYEMMLYSAAAILEKQNRLKNKECRQMNIIRKLRNKIIHSATLNNETITYFQNYINQEHYKIHDGKLKTANLDECFFSINDETNRPVLNGGMFQYLRSILLGQYVDKLHD